METWGDVGAVAFGLLLVALCFAFGGDVSAWLAEWWEQRGAAAPERPALRTAGRGALPVAPPRAARAQEAAQEPGRAAPLSLDAALAALPPLVPLESLEAPASPTAAPIGRTAQGAALWLDLADELLHMGLYGASGCGKDTWLRALFAALTYANPPEAVQFVFLDAKGDWMLRRFRGLAHMWRDPYGADVDDPAKADASAQVLVGITAVRDEMRRRLQLVNGADCRTREQYVARTGQVLPLLVVVFTDVGSDIEGAVEKLLIDLVSKARAVGMRIIVSMQTPTGSSMKWRTNLSTNVSGMITDGSQDGPALGLRDRASIRYAPSQLPHPKERPGVLVVRHGNVQHLVQGAYIDEDAFDAYVDTLALRAPGELLELRPAPQSTVGPPAPAQLDDDTLIAALVRRGVSGNKIEEVLGGTRAVVQEKVRLEKVRQGRG